MPLKDNNLEHSEQHSSKERPHK